MYTSETIVAPATPPGEGGVCIVRLSGPQAPLLLDKVFFGRTSVRNMTTHRLYHGRLQNRRSQLVDSVLAVVMRAPHSYTGEDVVEVHCHGSSQILRNVLDLFLDAGARMAEPGEFTRRAFLNGRLDLSQAEAVAEVIRARSERAGRAALSQLDGHLSRQVYEFTRRLKEPLALLEAHIDFPDDDVGSLDLGDWLRPLEAMGREMRALADSFDMGRVLREGVSLLILGRPNVGKSSLMNALLGESRAIVTEVAGTTRDTLEESIVVAGFPLRLVDAAGVRDTADPVEREGVRRAREKAESADLVLLVVDGSQPLAEEDFLAMGLCRPGSTLVVVNKSDLPLRLDPAPLAPFFARVEVSTRTGQGLEQLRSSIVDLLTGGHAGSGEEDLVVTDRRHRDALVRTVEALDRLAVAVGGQAPLECLSLELRDALDALGQITGETTPDEILDQIFSRFCIGK